MNKNTSTATNNLTSADYTRLSHSVLWTVKEAALMTGLGETAIRKLTSGNNNPLVLWNGSKRMVKRERMTEYLTYLTEKISA